MSVCASVADEDCERRGMERNVWTTGGWSGHAHKVWLLLAREFAIEFAKKPGTGGLLFLIYKFPLVERLLSRCSVGAVRRCMGTA